MVMAAHQCIQTHGAIVEVYLAPPKVCITIRVGYRGLDVPLVCHSGERVYGIPCENPLDRDLDLLCGNIISALLILALLPQLAQHFSS